MRLTDHQTVGLQYGITAALFLLIGFSLMLLMRWQLAWPTQPLPPALATLVTETNAPGGYMVPEFYNQLVAMHGTVMIFLAVVPLAVGGFGNYLVAPGTLFALFAGVYYWYPKITGRHTIGWLGHVHFWGSLVTMNAIFLPMFAMGLMGVNRRLYDAGLQYTHAQRSLAWNEHMTWNAIALGLFQLPFLANLVISSRRGRPAGNNPLGGNVSRMDDRIPASTRQLQRAAARDGRRWGHGMARWARLEGPRRSTLAVRWTSRGDSVVLVSAGRGMGANPDRVLSRVMSLCPICLGLDANSLTAGLPAGALVLVGMAAVVITAFARLVYRLWTHETP